MGKNWKRMEEGRKCWGLAKFCRKNHYQCKILDHSSMLVTPKNLNGGSVYRTKKIPLPQKNPTFLLECLHSKIVRNLWNNILKGLKSTWSLRINWKKDGHFFLGTQRRSSLFINMKIIFTPFYKKQYLLLIVKVKKFEGALLKSVFLVRFFHQ